MAHKKDMVKIDDLLEKLDYMKEGKDKIMEAYQYALKKHDGQYRKSGEPYIIHPLNVAIILTSVYADSDSIIAALLHDVVEDTDATLDEKIKLQHKLMIKLADDTISNNITSKEAMLTIYGNDIIDKLTNEFSIPSDDVVKKVPVANNNSEKEMTDNQMITNYQKISDYLKIRKTQLEEVAKGNSDIAITEKDDLIYQNVNTIFDLNIAAIISDNQYSSGQGIYAISQYLKTGEANRFTSF